MVTGVRCLFLRACHTERRLDWSADQELTRRLPDSGTPSIPYHEDVLVCPEKGNSMRVLLADSHDYVRSALRLLLEQETCVEVVGEAAATAQLLQEVARSRPDLLLLDWELAGPDATALVAELRQQIPDLRFIVLSSRSEVRKDAEAAGIDQFVSKSAFSEELLAALRGLAPGSLDSGQPAPSVQPPTPHEP